MGVCIGTCAKANIKQELEPAEKEEIKRNIDPVIQEVSEEDADKENE